MASGVDTQTDKHTHTRIPNRGPKQFQEDCGDQVERTAGEALKIRGA